MLSRRMSKKFNRIYKEARKPENIIPFDSEKDCLVLFSDHHKGDGSAADDFKKNARLYETALSYYKDRGYKLIVLGDNEELWENRYNHILPHYKNLIEKEIEISIESSKKKKIRIWGNHDKEVSLRRFKRFSRNMNINILDNVEYREGICLGEHIFLIHGHQGRFFDDKAWRVSRWAVKTVWKKTQKFFHIGIDGPAENFEIRDNLELQYYDWAKNNRVMLICGHTHLAIFGSLTYYDRLQIEIHHLKKILKNTPSKDNKEIKKEIERKKSQIDKILKKRLGKPPKSFARHSEWPIPCYFNDGCCGYTNGITCIEIEKNTIRLIKWDRLSFERLILVEKNLKFLLRYIKDNLIIDELLEPRLKRLPP